MLCHDITEYRNSCICRISENTRWHLRPLVLLSVACPSSLNMSGPFSHTRSNGAGGNPLRNPLFASRRASAHTHALESYRRGSTKYRRKTSVVTAMNIVQEILDTPSPVIKEFSTRLSPNSKVESDGRQSCAGIFFREDREKALDAGLTRRRRAGRRVRGDVDDARWPGGRRAPR